jgi:hypothetical protein
MVACGTSELDESTTIEGVVLDAETSAPVAGAEVSSAPITDTVTTGADGRFRLSTGVRFNQIYRVTAREDRYRPQFVDFTPRPGEDGREAIIRLERLRLCTPGEIRCAAGVDASTERCNADGTSYEAPVPCAASELCVDGAEASCQRAFTVTVEAQGGLVSSQPSGILCNQTCTEGEMGERVCPATCQRRYVDGASLLLVAQPFPGNDFAGWGTPCEAGATPAECRLTVDQDIDLLADFGQNSFGLEVQVRGNGSGRVTSQPPAVDCTEDCTIRVDRDTTLVLSAQPDDGSEFEEWGRGCSGSGDCTVTLDQDRTVRARFIVPTRTLTVTKEGAGDVDVTSDAGDFNCGGTCEGEFPVGTVVMLTASSASGRFVTWTGDCASFGSDPCTLVMDEDRGVGATFEGLSFPVVVTTMGSGTVTSDPAGIACGAQCSAEFGDGVMVELTATPDAGSAFGGWDGDCMGFGSDPRCTVLVDQALDVEARFDVVQERVTVAVTGDGRVVSTPAGIDCPGDCSEDFPSGSTVDLAATPGAGQAFLSWSGACTADPCSFAVNGPTTVDATFGPFFLAELPAGGSCQVLLRFDDGARLDNACAGGAPVIERGSWSVRASRTTNLGQAYGPTANGAAVDTLTTVTPPNATLELSVRPTGPAFGGAGTAVLFSDRDEGASGVGIELRLDDDGRLRGITRSATSTTTVETSTGAVPRDAWSHVAFTVSANRQALWVEGIELASTSTTVAWTASSTAAHVGGSVTIPAGRSVQGGLDEVRISNAVRY